MGGEGLDLAGALMLVFCCKTGDFVSSSVKREQLGAISLQVKWKLSGGRVSLLHLPHSPASHC